MNIVLSTAGKTAMMDAEASGYKLNLGKFLVHSTGTDEANMPLALATADVDLNPIATWVTHTTEQTAIDEYSNLTPDVLHMVCTIPANVGSFEFDALSIYLEDGTLLGIGTYERPIVKTAPSVDVTSNILELEAFIRFTSVSSIINVTRDKAKRPYSFMTEYDRTDNLGSAKNNSERIYRITRPSDALGDTLNAFNTFLVSAGIAFFDNVGKPYQKNVWIPSDHLALFGSDTLSASLQTADVLVVKVPKNRYPMIEHITGDVEYLLSTSSIGLENALDGLLLEAKFALTNSITDPDFHLISFSLSHGSFASLIDVDIRVKLFVSNSDASAQTAVRIALRRFFEMQYKIGRRFESDDDIHPSDILEPYLGYVTYWQKLNGIVSVSTSTTDGNISSAGQLYELPPYGLDGRNMLAPVLRATNVWMRYDPSGEGMINYSLSADRTNVDEGGSVTFTLQTTGLTNGSLVGYTVTGIDQNDLSAGSLTGNFVIQNNLATATFTLSADEVTEGDEVMKLTINADPTIFRTVTVRDTSVSVGGQAFFGVSQDATTGVTEMNEGQTRFFIAVLQGIPDGTYVYTRREASSTADAYDLSTPIPTSVRVLGGRAVFPVSTIADKITEGDEVLAIGVYRDATFNNNIVTGSVIIKDTSKAPALNMFFSSKTDGSDNINNTTVPEGSYVYLVVDTQGYDVGKQFSLRYGNSETPSTVEVNDSDFGSVRPTVISVNSTGRTVVAYYLAVDYVADQGDIGVLEDFHVEITDVGSSAVKSRCKVQVQDTSYEANGTILIEDITGSTPITVYDSLVATMFPSSAGLLPATAAYHAPLDYGLIKGKKYRLTYILDATPTTRITRARLSGVLGNMINYGSGIGSTNPSTSLGGKALQVLTGTRAGYGATFEFEIQSTSDLVNTNQVTLLGVDTNRSTDTLWYASKVALLPVREGNATYKISTDNDNKRRAITIPFGQYVDLEIITASGAGATSSNLEATDSDGKSGENGRSITIAVPTLMGDELIEKTNLDEPQTHDYVDRDWYINLGVAEGGKGGIGQPATGNSLTTSGISGKWSPDVAQEIALENLKTDLFGHFDVGDLGASIIFEVLRVVERKEFQQGRSSASSTQGGYGLKPFGSSARSGDGGKGGETLGTGYGFGGSGGAGSLIHVRIGTKIDSGTLAIDPSIIAPFTFYVVDKSAWDYVGSDTNASTPFLPAQTGTLVNSNPGENGSTFYMAALRSGMSSELASDVTDIQPNAYVRPTHNEQFAVSLPVNENLVDVKRLNQFHLPKYTVKRIMMQATGVEGSYENATPETVDGLASLPSRIFSYGNIADTAPDVLLPMVDAKASLPDTDGLAPELNVASAIAGVANVPYSLAVAGSNASVISRGGMSDIYVCNWGTVVNYVITEMPRVQLSLDNPLYVEDTTPYTGDNTWSDAVDAHGNSLSSLGYNLAVGDGVIQTVGYSLNDLARIRPWINTLPMPSESMLDTNVPIIIQQGQAVRITVVGGGGGVSTRDPDTGLTNDPAFDGVGIELKVFVDGSTSHTLVTTTNGLGSIDNTTQPVASADPAVISVIPSALGLIVQDTSVATGDLNPVKALYGGVGSGSYARLTCVNTAPQAIALWATGGKGGDPAVGGAINLSDGVVLVEVL